MSLKSFFSFFLCNCSLLHASEPALPHFRAVEIDSHIEIGYGITVADVDGDHKPDILLVDKKQIVWYKNPTWEKFVIAENLTPLDDVCIAAADIDGDGKAEIAVGAQWNPNDTLNSGAVFYLVPPADRTQKWEPIELPHEPTVHRMRWMQNRTGQFELVVTPLHGRGNRAGEGSGVRILGYRKPADPHQSWETELINGSLHLTHNFDLLKPAEPSDGGMLVASREGVFKITRQSSGWVSQQLIGNGTGETNFNGAGEVRAGKLAGGIPFLATVEPMHGTQLVVYTPRDSNGSQSFWHRQLLDASLKEGHALACGDLLGNGSDQIVVGWRAKNEAGKVGIKLFAALDAKGQRWTQATVDDNTMACEDLCLADLNGDGKLEIIASGRATKNVRIYFNDSAK
jgi:hypothetical protein